MQIENSAEVAKHEQNLIRKEKVNQAVALIASWAAPSAIPASSKI